VNCDGAFRFRPLRIPTASQSLDQGQSDAHRKSPALLLFSRSFPATTRLDPLRGSSSHAFGYTDFAKEAAIEAKFLDVPSAKLAGEELKSLTAEPHIAASPEDRKTAEYVAEKFRAAGLETEIVPYRVLLIIPRWRRSRPSMQWANRS